MGRIREQNGFKLRCIAQGSTISHYFQPYLVPKEKCILSLAIVWSYSNFRELKTEETAISVEERVWSFLVSSKQEDWMNTLLYFPSSWSIPAQDCDYALLGKQYLFEFCVSGNSHIYVDINAFAFSVPNGRFLNEHDGWYNVVFNIYYIVFSWPPIKHNFSVQYKENCSIS